MKLASYKNGTRDGELVVVSRDLTRAIAVPEIASTMIEALENWTDVAPLLASVDLSDAPAFDVARCMAPLPRSRQFLDGSAFLTHGRLMDKAFNMPPNPDMETIPMMYQGMSDDFRGPRSEVEFPSEADGIDFEGEFAVILDGVPMGTQARDALQHVRLVTQLNDWSLRALAVREMKVGFGWVQAKPTCSFAPVAVTPDELGAAWDGRLDVDLHIHRDNHQVGCANGKEMHFGFADLIAFASRTRRLHAGAIIGSGTVANADRSRGSSCLSEVRALEVIDSGKASTPFLSFGETVRMEARLADDTTPFGAIETRIVKG